MVFMQGLRVLITYNYSHGTLACPSVLNERIKSMGIGTYYISNNASDYQDYWASASSPLPKYATNVERCGCYIVKEKDEGDRAWVTYSTCYTYHYLCRSHMSERA